MKHLLTFLIFILISGSSYSQTDKTLFSKNSTLEAGFGAGLLSKDLPNFYRFQIATRDLVLDRFGFYYTFEYLDSENGDYRDLLGLTYRLSDKFSVQAATGLTNASMFTTKSFRKELALAYHPEKNPFNFIAGYSIAHGPTLTVNFKIFRKKKNEVKQVVVANNKPLTPVVKESTTKINKPTEQPKKAVSVSSNIEKTAKSTVKNVAETAATAKATIDKKPKVTSNPKVDYDKLCDDNMVSNKYNSAVLSDNDKAKLNNFVSFLKFNPKYKLKITGRADKIGSDEYNLALGQRRADNAKKYLINKGVNSNQLISISVGESQSQNANTPSERAIARSTIFKIVTP